MSKRAINNSRGDGRRRRRSRRTAKRTSTPARWACSPRFDARARRARSRRSRRKWFVHGFQVGFSTPVVDEANGCSTRSTTARSCSASTCRRASKLWDKNLGTLQKGSPVLADGKLYVGTENGKFYILKPTADGVEVLDEDACCLGAGGTGGAEPARADRRLAGRRQRPRLRRVDGRALRDRPEGREGRRPRRTAARDSRAAGAAAGAGPRRSRRSFPSDVTLTAGRGAEVHGATSSTPTATASRRRRARRRLGARRPEGHGRARRHVHAGRRRRQPGRRRSRRRSARSQRHRARARDAAAAVRGELRRHHRRGAAARLGQLDRQVRRARISTAARCCSAARTRRRPAAPACSSARRTWPTTPSRRTCASPRSAASRATSGVIAQRYVFVLFGNSQKIELQPWQPNPADDDVGAVRLEGRHLVSREAARCENQKDGTRACTGKAWPRGEAEPAAWLVEKIDKHRPHAGQPRPLRRRAVRRVIRQRQGDEQRTLTVARVPRKQLRSSPLAGVVAVDPRAAASSARASRGRLARPMRRHHATGRCGAARRTATWSRPRRACPTTWDVKTKTNVKWVADLGSQTYGNADRRRRQGLRRHQQRSCCATRSRPAIAAC